MLKDVCRNIYICTWLHISIQTCICGKHRLIKYHFVNLSLSSSSFRLGFSLNLEHKDFSKLAG